MPDVVQRARTVLTTLSIQPATSAASGRYLRSRPIRVGVRYWATSQPRYEQDAFGVQFFGEGVREAERLEARLVRAGFIQRTPQTNQRTFARPIPYGPGDTLDLEAARAARADLDAILSDAATLAAPGFEEGGFRAFMLDSPLAETDLPPVDRTGAWRVRP
jgi:hypothetical protein